MRRREYLTLVVAAALLACGGEPRASGAPVRLTIPRGATVPVIADTLRAHGLIASARWFRVLAQLKGQDRAIRAGVYDVERGRSTGEVLALLVSGPLATQRLVVPEGLMLHEVAAVVEDQLDIPRDAFVAAARDSVLRARVEAQGPTLEGYLYPSTYHVRIGADAREVAAHMVREFEARWQPAWNARLDSLGMSRWEIVILASIIEGEVRHDADRRFVSSVYHNRLRAGWRLQADPTVIYALGRRRRLYEKDYLIRSPYNTYQIEGLPPGPIGQPSAASLEAALYPAHTDFFYLVARPDGHHIFSRTLREHRQAVAQVRRQRRVGGGSR